jgi:hypothetical protein
MEIQPARPGPDGRGANMGSTTTTTTRVRLFVDLELCGVVEDEELDDWATRLSVDFAEGLRPDAPVLADFRAGWKER